MNSQFTHFVGGKADFQRYADIVYPKADNETRTSDEIISSIVDRINGGIE